MEAETMQDTQSKPNWSSYWRERYILLMNPKKKTAQPHYQQTPHQCSERSPFELQDLLNGSSTLIQIQGQHFKAGVQFDTFLTTNL